MERKAAKDFRVLVVDDMEINRMVMGAILEMLDVEVVEAVDGQEAVEAVARQAFDLVLMDIQMPVMDGLTATREIRALEEAAGRAPTPIIAVTANAMSADVARCLAAGCDRHVAKPVTPAELLRAMAETLAERATPGDAPAWREALHQVVGLRH